MRNVLLIPFTGKIPNLALMKLSTFYKRQGDRVFLNRMPEEYGKPDIVHCSVLFSWDRDKALQLRQVYPNIQYGGTGWDVDVKLTKEQEDCLPDYDLYSADDLYHEMAKGSKSEKKRYLNALERVNAGIGFTTRGCIRSCPFCLVPKKEGKLQEASKIEDIINPRSNKLFLLDNNFTADPKRIDKLEEMIERKLTVKLSQGIDVRLLDEPTARLLGKLSKWGSLPYAWDLMESEEQIVEGIKLLQEYVPAYIHTCFVLVGYNTTFEQDLYRVRKLQELGVRPYIMRYNNRKDDIRLNHFTRWITGFFYKKCTFDEYIPWLAAQNRLDREGIQLSIFDERGMVG